MKKTSDTYKSKCLSFVIVIVVLSNVWCASSFAAINAGSARIDITPPVGVWLSGYAHRNKPSDAIEDPLFAKAIVLDDTHTKIAIVSTDLLWVPLEITRTIRREVNAKIGIATDNILICATHTHFGPKVDRPDANWPDAAGSKISDSYLKTLKEGVVKSICRANENLKPALIGATKGRITEIVYNRRTKRADGTVAMSFRLPPPEEGLTFGGVDPEVPILRVESQQGELIAAVVNYACHPVSGAKEVDTFYSISADYPGITTQAIEKIEGGTCLFALGTAGNMNPRRLNRKHPRSEIGKALAGEVLRRIQTVSTSDDIKLKALRKEVSFPLKKSEDGDDKQTLTTEIQLLAIGNTCILGLPGEVLVEIGLEIKKNADVENLLIISLANDTIGYVCPEEAYKQGGYEPTGATKLAPGAGELMVAEALELIAKMKSK